MAEVNVLLPEVCDCKVDAFCVTFDRHSRFDVLGDVPARIAGAVGVVDGNRDADLTGLESVFLDETSVDRAAGTAAIQQSLGVQCPRPRHGVQDEYLP